MEAPRPTHSTIAGVPASNFQGSALNDVFSSSTDWIISPPLMKGGMSLSSSSRPHSAPAPLGPGQLVAREGEEVAAQRLHVDGAVRRRLRAVDHDDRVALVRPVADLAHGVERAERVRLVHDRDEAHAALALDRRELVEIEAAVVGHADVAQRGARPVGEQLPRHHVRVVLHLAADDHVAGPAVGAAVGVGDEVEGLGGVAHEDALAPVARIHEARRRCRARPRRRRSPRRRSCRRRGARWRSGARRRGSSRPAPGAASARRRRSPGRPADSR